MRRDTLYLLLFVAGAAIPYCALAPWLVEHGLNLPLLFDNLFANRVSTFFAFDVLISAVTLFVFAGLERRDLGSMWWLPLVATLLFGVCAGLPLALYLRERGNRAMNI